MYLFKERVRIKLRDFPGVQVITTLPSNAGGVSSIPGQGTKNPDVLGCGKKVKKIVIIIKKFFKIKFKKGQGTDLWFSWTGVGEGISLG